MLTCSCVKRLLTILTGRSDRKPRTAIYVARTGDLDGLGKYVRQFLEDESYISRNGYKFDYDEDDVFIEKTETYEFFKSAIARDYEIIFIIEGDESEQIREIVDSLPDSNNMVFIPMDCKLRAYKFLEEREKTRQLKRKVS